MSIDAGTPPEPGNGRPAAEPSTTGRRGLRDRPLGRLLLLAAVFLAAAGVARSCGSHDQQISQQEAVEIATERAAFTPCSETGCVMVRAIQQGIPTRLVWVVGLAEELDANGRPTRYENFVIDAATGDVTDR